MGEQFTCYGLGAAVVGLAGFFVGEHVVLMVFIYGLTDAVVGRGLLKALISFIFSFTFFYTL